MHDLRVLLVGCSKAKLDRRAPARELYTGSLVRAARAYAETSGLPWLILSAKHGVIGPDLEIDPYDQRIPRNRDELDELRRAVGFRLGRLTRGHSIPRAGVAPLLDQWPHDERTSTLPMTGLHVRERTPHRIPVTVEIHAGSEYVELVRSGLSSKTIITVVDPLEGLMLGERLAWYKPRAPGAQLDLISTQGA